jgi:hypothetical protein
MLRIQEKEEEGMAASGDVLYVEFRTMLTKEMPARSMTVRRGNCTHEKFVCGRLERSCFKSIEMTSGLISNPTAKIAGHMSQQLTSWSISSGDVRRVACGTSLAVFAVEMAAYTLGW